MGTFLCFCFGKVMYGTSLLQASLTLRWSGWRDSLAGIKGYEVDIYKLVVYGNKLAHHGEAALVRKSLGANQNTFTTNLVDPGTLHYVIIAIVIIVYI